MAGEYPINLSDGTLLITIYPLEENGPGNLSTPRQIVDADNVANTFTLAGDVTFGGDRFQPGDSFDVQLSGGGLNDGTYTVITAVFGTETVISVLNVPASVSVPPLLPGATLGQIQYTVPLPTHPLLLNGRGSLHFGENQNENMIHMVEHFADVTANIPPDAQSLLGQLFWSTDEEIFYRFTSTGWTADIDLGSGAMLFADPQNVTDSTTDMELVGDDNDVGLRLRSLVDDNASVTTTNFVIGESYRISTVGDTDFTLIGASANTVGVSFVATGPGGGTTGVAAITHSAIFRITDADGTTERLRVEHDGYIRTTNPIESTSSGDNLFTGRMSIGSGSTPSAELDVTGDVIVSNRVGINNAVPTGTVFLEVTGDIQANSQFRGSVQSVAAPTFAFNSDLTSGMYLAAIGNLGFSAAGTNRFNILSTGVLNVAGTASYENLVVADNDIPNKKYVDDAAVPAGADNEIQYNNAGAFGADPSFTIAGTTAPTLSLGDGTTIGNSIIQSNANSSLLIRADGTPTTISQQVGILGGNGATTFNGGPVVLTGGIGGTTSGDGGDVIINGGIVTDGAGGDVLLRPRDGGTNGNGGRVDIDVGAGAGAGADGYLQLIGGSGTVSVAMRFREATGGEYVAIKAPDSVAVTRTWALPQDDPTAVAGDFLTTDASGVLSFAPPPVTGLQNIIEDLSPQLGGNLDVLSRSITRSTIGTIDIIGFTNVAGAGGGVDILGGSGSTSGGVVNFRGGTGPSGGVTNIRGGTGTAGNGGDVLIDAGGGTSAGGRIFLRPGLDTVDGNNDGHIVVGGSVGTNATVMRFLEAGDNGNQYVSISAPDAVTTNRDWTLPQDDPASVTGQFLTTDASGNLSFAAGGAAIVSAFKTTTESVISSTLFQDDDEMTGMVLAASTSYAIEGVVHLSMNAVAMGAKIRLNVSAGGISVTDDFLSGTIFSPADTPEGKVTSSHSSGLLFTGFNNALSSITFSGMVTTTGAGATIDFQWAQNVSDGAALQFREGTWIKFTKIS